MGGAANFGDLRLFAKARRILGIDRPPGAQLFAKIGISGPESAPSSVRDSKVTVNFHFLNRKRCIRGSCFVLRIRLLYSGCYDEAQGADRHFHAKA